MAAFYTAKVRFVDRLKHFFFDDRIIAEIQSTNPFAASVQRERASNISWFVLPFHPDLTRVSWQATIRATLEEFAPWLARVGISPQIRTSWRNILKPMAYHLRRIFLV